MLQMIRRLTRQAWIRFWMRYAGLTRLGRLSAWMASLIAPPYKGQCTLAQYHPLGFVAPTASIRHRLLRRNRDVYIGQRVTIFQSGEGGPVELGPGVQLYSDIIIETGEGGAIQMGDETHVQARGHFAAYVADICIGRRVEIGPGCSFFSYDHSFGRLHPVRHQPLRSKGDIVIGDDAWLGVNVTVLNGVHIGQGAVIGAGSLVTSDVPDFAIAIGSPARVIKMRQPDAPDLDLAAAENGDVRPDGQARSEELERAGDQIGERGK